MASASLYRSRPRSAALIFGHGPDSNALRAAFTARSTSALSPSATLQMTSPVAGFCVSNVLPETESTHLPPISIGWSLTCGGWIPVFGDETFFVCLAVAVGIAGSSMEKGVERDSLMRTRQGPL